MSRAVIISGGTLDEGFVEQVLAQDEGACVIGVDRGLEYLYQKRIQPQYIVGDFDSIRPEVIAYYRDEARVPIREYNPIKDASDTEIALRLAMTLGCTEIVVLGATGGRIDHLWANIQTLAAACRPGVTAYILDPRNKIWVIDRPCTLKKAEAYGTYLSVFSLSGEIYDFSLRGTKWPLSHHVLKPLDSLTVSNQFEADEVEIEFPDGLVVVMETRD